MYFEWMKRNRKYGLKASFRIEKFFYIYAISSI